MSKSESGKLAKNNTISVASLRDKAIIEATATKEGGSYKSWKKRFFLLVPATVGNNRQVAELYYFKSESAKSAIGVIKITDKSTVKEISVKGKQCIEIDSGPLVRKYLMYCSSSAEQSKFVNALKGKIDSLKTKDTKPAAATGGGATGAAVGAAAAGAGAAATSVAAASQGPPSGIQAALQAAKSAIPFLAQESGEDRILEFWQIWTESIPGSAADVSVTLVMTSDMSQLSWRVFGPQNVLIQEMVDFFWNVGAPEQEIDRLNDVGGLINPITIGSWIDMSTKGGMDGGWVFPVTVNMTDALKACDEGTPLSKLTEWTRAHNVDVCVTVGRDMGASPPRQTEIRFIVKGDTFDSRLNLASSAYRDFGFPAIPDSYISLLRQWNPSGMQLSVITSSEGFVRIGMIFPDPDKNTLTQLCNLCNANPQNILAFQDKLKIAKPAFVEFQHLMDSFGYGVYNEGLNVVFHYSLGV